MPEGPLAGRRIVVTRPRGQAGGLAEELERLGASVSIVPLVEIRPLDDDRALDEAVASPAGYDWVVFTSANGVAAVGDDLRARLGAVRVAAVGPATADALRAAGVEPAFVPERFLAEEIVPGLGPLAGTRVLLPQADIADGALADELRAGGAAVTAVTAYRTVEVSPDAAGALALREAGAVVLASASAARSLAAAAPWEDTETGPLLVAIGPKTAAAAREHGLTVALVAPEASAEGIIHALVSHFGESMG